MSEVTLRIGDVARATGTSPRLLRYYEEQGLLAPARSSTGQRLYVADDVDRVARVRRLLDAGLTTTVIAQVLACACGGTGDVEPCLDPLLRDELARIDSRLAQLTEHRDRLARIARHDAPARPSGVAKDPALLLSARS
ncbi:MerR family transcriptional regulator [Isoptericola sp. BMS4]|uniref:MerR family transcriptional regulator n=1 Tax=Isoptericola sp. BMS4 TaxID=2527875 RepID=UPI00196B8241|nr:MerR family transcriptional regulator [Isoptericola sp. BMS4]